MAGEWPDDLETAFLAAVETQLPGEFKEKLDHEPQKLRGKPAITMYAVAAPDEDTETGPRTEVAWEWRVNIYCDLTAGYKEAQDALKALWPKALRAIRVDPSLGVDGAWARLEDPGREPVIEPDEKVIWKSLRLRIRRMES